MKQETAFTLIGDHLAWTDADFAKEFQLLQLMIDHKYDSYQGYQPGTRFHVSLLNWLSQFDDPAHKQAAYAFIKERLVYVSQREMHHLVSLMMPIIERSARQRVAQELQIPLYQAQLDETAKTRCKHLMRRTLYVGLSDGARIDVFRRYNEGKVSNEQVLAFSEITRSKWEDLREELTTSLRELGLSEAEASQNATFESICLVDDFSGSGSSLLRHDDKKQLWKGKIPKFCASSLQYVGEFIAPGCTLHIHHHLASEKAEQQIAADLSQFRDAYPAFQFTQSFSYVLPDSIVINDQCEAQELTALLKMHYDSGIEDKHTGPLIWYGYKQGGLPLVLEHNTPNNSIALLWAESADTANPRMKPLFMRRKRHSSHG